MSGVQISIGADSRKASRELKSFEKKTKGIAASIAKGFKERIGHKLLDGLSSAAREIPQLLNSAINDASSLNEEVGKSAAVFGKSAGSIKQWSETTADAFGISKLEAMRATGTMGNMLGAFGIAGDEASKMSMRLVELAADMGSFNEASVEDTIFAIGAALRGENEPIRKFGVDLNDARLKQKALEEGLYSGKGALIGTAKAMAAYSLILEQTGIQQGNFAQTANDLENSKKRLTAKLADLTLEIGEKFLPVMGELVTVLNNVDFEEVADNIDTVAVGFSEWGKTIGGAYDALSEYGELVKTIVPALQVLDEAINFASLEKVERKKSGMTELPDFLKEKEEGLSESEQIEKDFAASADEAWDKEKKRREEEKAYMKEHDEMAKASLHAERERLELLEQQNKEREKAAQQQRDDVKRGIKDDIAGTLESFGISGASQGNMLNDLLGIGFGADEANRLVGMEGNRQSLLGTRDSLDSASSRSSISAVSSLQRVGGGGGVYGELDLQRRQTDLQTKMVSLLEELKTEANTMPLSDF